jgi:hypothetical protein
MEKKMYGVNLNTQIKRTFDIKDASVIHNILLEAFKHIQPVYTEEAFDATVG